MSLRVLLLAAALGVAAVRADAAMPDPKTRSTSSSRQFIVYCPDAALRGRITGFVDDVRADVLELLGDAGHLPKIPIVVTIEKAPAPGGAPVRFQMFSTPEGPKIQIDVAIGDEPANLRKEIVRAVLLEYAYAGRPAIEGGERYVEAPWWLIDGAIELFSRRDIGVDSDFFRRLVEINKLPSLEQFLTLRAGGLGRTADAIDGACALGLVQALVDQPTGRANLARLVQHWPEHSDDPMDALAREFPSLAGGTGAAQKWWTLNLARFAAANRYKGFSAEETDQQLAALLQIEVVIDKAGTKKTFPISEYAQFIKLRGSRAIVAARQKSLIALSTQANALIRPVVADYEEIFGLLARGKTRRLAERIEETERYRATILHRRGEIADYLNWYEATQLGTRTNAFDSYLKAAHELSRDEAHRSEPIAKYLDQLEQEY
jgi:hypothetical protein